MANFKVKQLDVKLGMTVEINGTWTRIDNGMVMENLDIESVLTKSEIKEQFQKCEVLLEEELVRRVKKIKG